MMRTSSNSTALLVTVIISAMLSPPQSLATEQKKETIMTLSKPWIQETNTRVLVDESTGSASSKISAPVTIWRAVYKFSESDSKGRADYAFVCIHDMHNHKLYFCDADHDFYILKSTGVVGYTLSPTGELIWSNEYFAAQGDVKISSLQNRFEALIQEQDVKRKWSDRVMNRLQIGQDLPKRFFNDSPSPGGMMVRPKINNAEIKQGILVIDFENPITKVKARIEINTKSKTLIKTMLLNPGALP